MVRITPYQLDSYTAPLINIYGEIEQDIFLRMAQLLKTRDGVGFEGALAWQAEKLQQVRAFNQETIVALSKATDLSVQEITNLFRTVGIDTIQTIDEQIADRLTAIPIPSDIDIILQEYVDQVFDGLDNYVNAVLITTALGKGVAQRTLEDIIERVTARVLVGNITVNQAVAQAVIQAREKGLPSGYRNKAGRIMNIQSYTDAVVRTTVNRTYNELAIRRMDEYDVHLVVVDHYSGARPACQGIQGTVASTRKRNTEGYKSIYDFKFGDPDGFRGINCKHSMRPFIPELNTNNNNPPSIEEADKVYKQMQKQRSLEREVRKAKQNLRIAEQVGDQDSIDKWKKNIRVRQTKVKQYTEQTGLARRYDKERLI